MSQRILGNFISYVFFFIRQNFFSACHNVGKVFLKIFLYWFYESIILVLQYVKFAFLLLRVSLCISSWPQILNPFLSLPAKIMRLCYHGHLRFTFYLVFCFCCVGKLRALWIPRIVFYYTTDSSHSVFVKVKVINAEWIQFCIRYIFVIHMYAHMHV